MVFENNTSYITIEFNYKWSSELDTKNYTYICELYLRQILKSKDYVHLKKIYQINLDNYDSFKEGKFVYFSEFQEIHSHKSRNKNIVIVDINLEYLDQIDYNKRRKGRYAALEKLLYIFVCNDEEVLDQIYKGDKLMESVREDAKLVQQVLDSFLYYDREELLNKAAERQGMEKGLEQGKKEQIMESAKRMLSLHVDKEIILKSLDISNAELEKLKKEM